MLRLSRTYRVWPQVKASNRLRGSTFVGFHSQAPRFSESRDPPSGHSPFKVFVDTFKQEWAKSKDLQDNIKALQDETGRMAESTAYKRAKDALETAKSGTNATGEGIRKISHAVGSTASQAWDSKLMKETRKAVKETADTVDKATEPIRQTKAYQNIKEVIDDGSSMRYGGYEEKEVRRKRRVAEERKRIERALKEGIRLEPVKKNENAGENVILHETAKVDENGQKWQENWEKSTLGKKMADLKIMYEESENGFVSTVRSVTDKIGSFFDETEGAKVIKTFKQMDPAFNQEDFLREVRAYILPEVLDAYVKGDADVLKLWLSEAPYNIWASTAKSYREKGLYSAGRILDIRGVDIMQSKILQPANIPVFVIGCRAQEVHLFKNAKTNEIEAGMEDRIVLSTYVMVVTREAEKLDNKETKGWKILELVRGQSRDWT